MIAWAKSPDGQARIKAEMKQRFASGDSFGGFSVQDVTAAAQALSNTIAQNVPSSLMGTYQADVSVVPADDGFRIDINIFDDDLPRPSIYSTNPGVENIYALFSKGWKLGSTYRKNGRRMPLRPGYWHGKRIYPKRERRPEPFIRLAVEDWINSYGVQFNVTSYNINSMYQ